MFIDVTRYGGQRPLRLATSAIAYMDAVEGGTAIHLAGGETLRVSETPEQVERAIIGTMQLVVGELTRDPLEGFISLGEAQYEAAFVPLSGAVLPIDPAIAAMEDATASAAPAPPAVLTRKPRGRC